MVDVFVGLQKQHFHIHRSVLVSYSDFFRGMFLHGFKERKEKSATLLKTIPRSSISFSNGLTARSDYLQLKLFLTLASLAQILR